MLKKIAVATILLSTSGVALAGISGTPSATSPAGSILQTCHASMLLAGIQAASLNANWMPAKSMLA